MMMQAQGAKERAEEYNRMHIFDIFSIIGTIAFAMSGAFVAMEEEYDILGVMVLGLVTAFGGESCAMCSSASRLQRCGGNTT